MVTEKFLSEGHNFPSLQKSLEQSLLAALAGWLSPRLRLTFYFSLTQTGLRYRSPLARQLARGQIGESLDLVTSWLPDLRRLTPWQISYTSEGYLDFFLPATALGDWLENLPSRLVMSLPHLRCSAQARESPFTWQYTSRRCHSLLLLAAREKILTLAEDSLWPIQSPQPIPWRLAKPLWLEHPCQRQVLQEILLSLDRSTLIPSHLSQSLLNLERDCRIFGSTYRDHPSLALTRLGLLALGKILLTCCLEAD